ncbi:hypothetical protein [Luedemannella helvata]|uniref:Uncharacterized protein n=1 Tax=Luedemannella helvata TaxID=349315 RepID=A0ABP4X385_9ACTN
MVVRLWLACLVTQELLTAYLGRLGARVRLVCLPHAGCNAAFYRPGATALPAWAELTRPGRRPQRLFIFVRQPARYHRRVSVDLGDDDGLWAEMGRLGGTGGEALDNPVLRALALPARPASCCECCRAIASIWYRSAPPSCARWPRASPRSPSATPAT